MDHSTHAPIRSLCQLGGGRVALGLILLCYLALAILGAFALPIGEGPDEPAHIAFVKHISTERSLPNMRDSELSNQVIAGFQGPGYYVLGAVVTGGMIRDEIPFYANPQFAPSSGQSAYLHGPGHQLLYSSTILGVRMLRLVSVLLGLGTIWVCHRLFLEYFSDEMTALFATGFVALNPQFLHLHSYVTNDALAIFIGCAASYWILSRGFSSRTDVWIVAGVLVGVGVLTKISAVIFAPATILCWYYIWRDEGRLLVVIRSAVAMGATSVAVSGWWLLRNFLYYGDPTGLEAKRGNVLGLNLYPEPLNLGEWIPMFPGIVFHTFRSYVGNIGYVAFPLPTVLYVYFAVLILVGGVAFLAPRTGVPPALKRRRILVAVMTVFALVAFVRFTTVVNASGWQGRFLMPIGGLLTLIIVDGLARLRGRNIWLGAVLLGFILAQIYYLVWVYAGVYLAEGTRYSP